MPEPSDGSRRYFSASISQPIGPAPLAMGSFSHSGGVSQTKARMAKIPTYYIQVAP